MLSSLCVRQFALIEAVDLELGPGMTVFTGETGAGKSMLIDALGAVFGARANADWVRHGADKAEIIAVWEGDDAYIRELLKAQDIDSDDTLILRRTITADGRSRAFVNGIPVPVRLLQQIGRHCLDLHGQHEHQALLQSDFQRRILDDQVDPALLASVHSAFADWHEQRRRLADFHQQSDETRQQAEWMRLELARLQELTPEPGLMERLEHEIEQGRHHSQLQQAAATALMLLDEGEPGSRDMLAKATHALEACAHMHPALAHSLELLQQADTLIAEALPDLREVMQQPFDEQALHAAAERLMNLHDALRRHQTDEAGLLELQQCWQRQLEQLDTAGWDVEALQQALQEAEQHYLAATGKLHEARRQAADALTTSLRPLLDRLALQGMNVRFHIEAEQDADHWHAHGRDRIGIDIMANPGEPWKPLNTTISGGELSRFVLALKGCDALKHAPPLAVFDEVDSGVGGETAWCIGQLLATMGNKRQVLVISHLPQVAACAHQQIRICKQHRDGRTLTTLEPVQASDREGEIARMLGGDDAPSREHARSFLARGRERR